MTLEPHPQTARTRPRSAAATRLRLLEAALELLCEHGIDDVSVRDISDAAGASPAAINYHFGSKVALLEELLRRQATNVTARRTAMLDEAQGTSPTLRQIAEIFVHPMLERGTEEFGVPGTDAVFLSAAAAHPDYSDLLAELYEPSNRRLFDLVAAATPHLRPEVRSVRWAMAKDLVNHAVANPRSPFNSYLRYMKVAGTVSLSDALIDVIAAIFGAESTI